jgi:stage II sporulation protein B
VALLDKPNGKITVSFHDKSEDQQLEIMRAEEEVAATSEKVNEAYNKPDQQVNSNSLRAALVKRSKRSKWLLFFRFPRKMMLPMMLAIIIGVTLGIIVLKIFTVDSAVVSQEGKVATNDITTTPTNPPEVGKDIIYSTEIPNLSVAVIQKFATASSEKANELVREYQLSGLPAATFETEGLHYIFIGIAPSKESATKFSHHFQQEGQEEPYVKPLTINGGTYENKDQALVVVMEHSVNLLEALIMQSANALQSETISSSEFKSIDQQMAVLMEEINDTTSLSENERQFFAEVTGAYTNLKDYQRQQDMTSLWQSQQAVLNAVTMIGALIK